MVGTELLTAIDLNPDDLDAAGAIIVGPAATKPLGEMFPAGMM